MMRKVDSLTQPKPGEVRLPDGRIVDRSRVCFTLRSDVRDPSILYSHDCAYKKQPDGSLRRVVKKMTKKERRQNKRNNK